MTMYISIDYRYIFNTPQPKYNWMINANYLTI